MTSATILVPIDFEEGSLHALRVASELAVKLDARVVLLHVYTLPVYLYPGMAPIQAPTLDVEVEAAAKKALDDLASRAGGLRAILRSGDAATRILEAIDEIDPSLVVMGTHGRRGVTRVLLGSVAEYVARRSKVPVMTVRPPEPAPEARAP